ncbi:uncharacterized protein EV420DRAFT_579216 [Desarmillaria tabescens]|uniref:Uncharacterized protein n=1 Tax=Armillaria tabescens TaxID=1929756 RepID=A0AA39J062_ARMTA|nr:uncharacterized protein EV420DRAFT_579216 [Desarmillaria tabescens]KAK0433065.1 hypothetical protein EV420DRAFT_579216 [Desarmillaria tabescens]
MNNLCRLDITCDADVEQFECIIELPMVASLTLRDGESSNGLPLVWSLLRLDNLHTLSLSYEGNILDPAWPRISLPNYGITTFKISYTDSVHNFDFHDNASIGLLCHLPNIESLHLTLPFFCTRLFGELRSNPKFLPRLVDIMFLCWDLRKDADIMYICHMLKSRCRALGCATISKLTLHCSDPLKVHSPITPGWESLLKPGLIVSCI